MLDKDALNSMFDYKEGVLYWKNPSKKSLAGKPAGCNSGHGYIKIQINGTQYYAHRIIYCMHHGYWPIVVDHKDRDTSNNRIENLRAANPSTNGMNSTFVKSTCGVRNVSFHRKRNKYGVYLKVDGKGKFFGNFDSLDDAANAAKVARETVYGEFSALEAA